ncbi:MAG: peptidase [Porticoccaceae bacterium]|nr:peptidase [Pseudomonadales bacterium]MCP5172107.1 peptidase [Pseudomonadales bacterium]
MTYCLSMVVNDGLVFCSDSRTNAGSDMLSSYSKMHVFRPDNNRVFCILSAGNLATTQAVISQLEQDLEDPGKTSLLTCNKMFEAARYVSAVNRNEQVLAEKAASGSGVDMSASLILGGQIRGGGHAIYLIYPAGNFIAASEETPYLQIGESKYGKPILDRIISADTSLEDAARCAIVSMDSTIKSNATVGPPIEVLVYEKDSFDTDHYIKMEVEDEYLREIKRSWDETLKAGFSSLPRFEWETRAVMPIQGSLPQSSEQGTNQPFSETHHSPDDILPSGSLPSDDSQQT